MNYQKVTEELEHHAREAADFLAGFPDADEVPTEKAAHRAMVCAVAALKKLTAEVARLKRCEEASIQMRDYLVEQIIPEADEGEPVGGMLKYALENTQWWDWEIPVPNSDYPEQVSKQQP